MNIRRFLRGVILALVFLMLVAGTAWAEASPEGALRALFNTGGNAQDTIMWHVPNDRAVAVAAPVLGWEGRIVPWQEGQIYCDDQAVGTWVFWFVYPGVANQSEADEQLGGINNVYVLDGVDLAAVERTPLKRFFPTFHDGTQYWGFAEGVPVIGTLEAGTHSLEWEADFDGVLISEASITFEVLACGG